MRKRIFLAGVLGVISFIPNIPLAQEISFIPLTLREGFESQVSTIQPLEDPDVIYDHKTYLKDHALAEKAGLDLLDALDKKFVSAYSHNNFFMLFFNLIECKGCERKYLIQKVKLSKYDYDNFGNKYNEKHQYLVEVLKLNNQFRTKKADEHLKRYSLGTASKRKIEVEVEAGSGSIPGVVEGTEWPYPKSLLYYKLQDYSTNVGYYNQVQFDVSKKYSFDFEFDANGCFIINWPDFLKQ